MRFEDESQPFLKEAGDRRDSRSTLEEQSIGHPVELWKYSLEFLLKFIPYLIVFVATSSLWGGLFILITRPSHHAQAPVQHHAESEKHTLISGSEYLLRGNSTEQAKSLGCKYDILANHWIPGICIDQEAIEEYQSDRTWYGYVDEERTQQLTIDTMSEMTFYYTNMRDHIVHCASLWKKQYRALFEDRKTLDSLIVDREHTMHCADFLMEMTDQYHDYRAEPIKVFVGFAGCHVRD